MQANTKILLQRLNKIETIATQLLQECAVSKGMLAGVSTPANTRKGNKAAINQAVIKRKLHIQKSNHTKKAVR